MYRNYRSKPISSIRISKSDKNERLKKPAYNDFNDKRNGLSLINTFL
ncbi:hypothetical protein TrispH2_005995 [Trichoplax sp. H2]|nr:hypothetical protein TrispH2_005995 [Trichoplax sp. H2]|eukprot:RDD42045.1 hypothetical protein TrispH2_005995 [Trichoplax sp. H2]